MTSHPTQHGLPPTAARTVGSLVDEHDLHVVSGGELALGRPVRHVVRLARLDGGDVHTLDDGTLIVTDGVARCDADACRRLVGLLVERGIGALALRVEPGDERDAQVLHHFAAAGRELDFAVIGLASEHACDDLARAVEIACLRTEIAVLERISSAQDYLMAALREARPADELVDRLAWLLGGDAILYNDGGDVVIATNATAAPAVWTAVRAGPDARQDLELDGRQVTTLPVRVDGRVRYWLAAAARREPGGTAAREAMLDAAARVLELLVRSRGAGAEAEDRATRAQLLSDLVTERDPSRLAGLSRRAERFGVTFSEPCRVALVLAAAARNGDHAAAAHPVDLGERLRVLLAGSRTPYLLDERPGEVAALVQGDCCKLLQEWLEGRPAGGEAVVVGLGREHTEVRETRDSLLDARVAASQLVRSHESGVLAFEDCHLTPWLIASLPPERLLPKVDALLAEVRANDLLHETLLAYLACDLDLRRTAAALHLHVNSVRYRLSKIEQTLGRPLGRVATLADLYIAITAEDAARG